MNDNTLYQEKPPCEELSELIMSFWMHCNQLDQTQLITISANSYINLIFFVTDNQITDYYLTGLWTEPKNFQIPPKTTVYGCRMKILAPEYLLKRELADLLNIIEPQPYSFLNINKNDLSNFDAIVKQWEIELLKIKSTKIISDNKRRFSKLLYLSKENLAPIEISKQAFWTNRQINRYLNKYVGLSLKKYLLIHNIRKAFSDIMNGNFSPNENYFDQSHYIREVKKHTGSTPKRIFKQKNDRFIQLKNISKK